MSNSEATLAGKKPSVHTIAMDSQLATRSDINQLERELRSDVNLLERERLIVKWMVGLVLGGIVMLVLKAFFPTSV
jgi:hypothetical protein